MRESPFDCPSCNAELPLADVNVGSDVALCRSCGRKGPFLGASSIPKLTDEELARPPKRVSLHRDFGDALVLTCQPKKTALWFLIPFTAFWSGISMGGIYGQQIARGQFDWKASLFGLPFLIGTLGLVTAILFNFFGHSRVTLTKGRVKVFVGLFGIGRTREMECGKDTTVSLQTSGYRVNNVPQLEIVLASEGKEIRFGSMALSTEEKKYVAAVLRRASGGG